MLINSRPLSTTVPTKPIRIIVLELNRLLQTSLYKVHLYKHSVWLTPKNKSLLILAYNTICQVMDFPPFTSFTLVVKCKDGHMNYLFKETIHTKDLFFKIWSVSHEFGLNLRIISFRRHFVAFPRVPTMMLR